MPPRLLGGAGGKFNESRISSRVLRETGAHFLSQQMVSALPRLRASRATE